MITIGIYDGHNASAALSIDGKIVCAVQEERFTKRKNESGFPSKAIQYILNTYNLSNVSIDEVAMSTIDRTDINNTQYPIDAVFGVEDYIDMMDKYWKPKLSGKDYPKDYAKRIFEEKFAGEKTFYNIPLSCDELSIDELQDKVMEVVINDVANFM